MAGRVWVQKEAVDVGFFARRATWHSLVTFLLACWTSSARVKLIGIGRISSSCWVLLMEGGNRADVNWAGPKPALLIKCFNQIFNQIFTRESPQPKHRTHALRPHLVNNISPSTISFIIFPSKNHFQGSRKIHTLIKRPIEDQPCHQWRSRISTTSPVSRRKECIIKKRHTRRISTSLSR